MSGIPEERIIQHRRNHRTDGGPLLTKEGKVQTMGRSLYLCIPEPLPDILDIGIGDTLDIHIYEDSYVVIPQPTEADHDD